MNKKDLNLIIDERELEELIKLSYSKSDICRALNIPINGTGMRKVGKLIEGYDVSHFGSNPNRFKYPIIRKICPICFAPFVTQNGHPKEKQTCSYSCSNTYFRSGKNNGQYNEKKYRNVCFENHEKKCIICGEDKIVAVHHFDENHENNDPTNLVPLCPTHHQYIHSGYKELIEEQVINYIENRKKEFVKK